MSSKIQDHTLSSGHTQVVVFIPYRDLRNLYKYTKIVSKTWDRCAKWAVHMRSTKFGGKTFFELKIKCVEHLRGYSSIGRALALQARGSEIKTLCFQKYFSTLAGRKPGIFWSVVKRLVHWATESMFRKKKGIARFWSSYLRVMSPTRSSFRYYANTSMIKKNEDLKERIEPVSLE